MNYLSKLYVTFSFAGKERDESRSDFIVSAISDIREKALAHHSDIVEISGELFSNDIKCFKRELRIEPISKERISGNKYSATFVISVAKLLDDSSAK